MANQQSKQTHKSKTTNQASAQGGQFGTEFASETDAQQVRQITNKLSKKQQTANH
ncbi:gamma-type small acid-soluble spore protein [Bacillus licheniformis]|nr:gamma-type small acid-soluble spore protein [Bacillus licheniformis]